MRRIPAAIPAAPRLTEALGATSFRAQQGSVCPEALEDVRKKRVRDSTAGLDPAGTSGARARSQILGDGRPVGGQQCVDSLEAAGGVLRQCAVHHRLDPAKADHLVAGERQRRLRQELPAHLVRLEREGVGIGPGQEPV